MHKGKFIGQNLNLTNKITFKDIGIVLIYVITYTGKPRFCTRLSP
jgi:hypothetical protein